MSESSSSEVYAPEGCLSGSEDQNFHLYRKRVEPAHENSIEGKWSDQESLQYFFFMEYHNKIFISKEKRKTARIFKSLSQYLKTRTPRQCRSHFQKIMNKFKTVKKVKQFYQEEMGVLQFQIQYDEAVIKIRREEGKEEESEEKISVELKNTEIQTEPLNVCLSDLPHSQLMKLIGLVEQHQKAQMGYWMPPYGNVPPTSEYRP